MAHAKPWRFKQLPCDICSTSRFIWRVSLCSGDFIYSYAEFWPVHEAITIRDLRNSIVVWASLSFGQTAKLNWATINCRD
jgi:hypothetical protein